MSLTAAQIQSIGETARENAQAGAPAVLEGPMLEELGIPAKDQGFSLTGNVGSATTSVVALLDATGEILRLRTIPEQALTGCTPGLATRLYHLSPSMMDSAVERAAAATKSWTMGG